LFSGKVELCLNPGKTPSGPALADSASSFSSRKARTPQTPPSRNSVPPPTEKNFGDTERYRLKNLWGRLRSEYGKLRQKKSSKLQKLQPLNFDRLIEPICF
jgi:hypothetical protein